MARLARVVVPGVPHHVTQRGNRRQVTFFGPTDYDDYLQLLRRFATEAGLSVWAYCLMPNHVHLVVVPAEVRSLARAIGETHRRYSRRVNFRQGWRGYLWQGRFASFPMDEPHLLAAVRYVELNPVRAGLVANPEEWRWSSATARVHGRVDTLLDLEPMRERVDDWASYLAKPENNSVDEALRLHQRTGRPLGSEAFLDHIERMTGRCIHPGKRGPKPKQSG